MPPKLQKYQIESQWIIELMLGRNITCNRYCTIALKCVRLIYRNITTPVCPRLCAGTISLALCSYTQSMGLCREEMASNEAIHNKCYWHCYKENKASYSSNCIVWGGFSELVGFFFPWEGKGYVFNTCLEYKFHDRKLLWNRLGSDFHIGPFFPFHIILWIVSRIFYKI